MTRETLAIETMTGGVLPGGADDAELRLVVEGFAPHITESDPEGIAAAIRQLQAAGLFAGKLGEAEAVPTCGLLPVGQLLLVGLGADRGQANAWRDAGVYAARLALQRGVRRLVLYVGSDPGDSSASLDRLLALMEGLLLGAYRKPSYQTEPAVKPACLQRIVLGFADETLRQRFDHALPCAIAAAEATNYARDLTNLPGNRLTPDLLAGEARQLAEAYGLLCIVHDEREIEELGMQGLYHVGKGSVHPPRMIVLNYEGDPDSEERYGLVGKGITFDTGGISLKPAAGMEEMISDMGGAAVLLGVMEALGRLKPKLNVTVVIPSAENMPSGAAYKPGDVIPTMSGRTVEVLNTDAEGRIVLADGITYAKRLGATRLIDVATLTGAILVCLGDVATGAVTNNEAYLDSLLAAARACGEKLWPLPAYPEYWAMLNSEVADIRNQTGTNKWAGAITGGLFIGTFAENTPWIHLDTGGTAWLWQERGTDPKGGTGAMVRTLLRFLFPPEQEERTARA